MSSRRLAKITMQRFLRKEKNFVEISMEQLKAKADEKDKIIFMMLPDSDSR